jgi:hypothetical protein
VTTTERADERLRRRRWRFLGSTPRSSCPRTAPGCNVGCPLQLTRIEPHLQINVLLKRGFRARHGPTMGCYAASGTIWLALSENDE